MQISIHAPREGCDCRAGDGLQRFLFQSTHPVRGATARNIIRSACHGIFQSTHPVRGATYAGDQATCCEVFQSTHPVRGATSGWTTCLITRAVISIHAPREGCDRRPAGLANRQPTFQSTHPVRGATMPAKPHQSRIVISIHAPREGCDCIRNTPVRYCPISIHAPREGCD